MTNTQIHREPSSCCRPVNRRRKINLSFAGCGFNGIYHVGVAVCLKNYAPHLLLNRISGASAGAIAACYLLCDLPVSSVTSDVLELVRLARKRTLGPFSPTFNVQDVLEEGLRKNLPEDAHLKVSGKLHISLTQLPGFRNVIVSRFYSKDDLVQALLASSFVPFFSGSHPPKFHGGYYMDGGFSNNLPTLDENTITVSPFCGETDICPRDDSSQLFHVNFANTSIEVSKQNVHRIIRILYPPKPEVLTKMCMQGFEDTLRYLQTNNLIKCAQYIAVESTFLVSSKHDEHETDEIEHDPECNDCLKKRQEALGATLPDSVKVIFQEAVDAANKGLVNWLFRIPGMKVLSFLALPYTLPFEIAYATITKFVSGPPHMPNNFMLMCEFVLDQLEHFMHIKSEPSTECVACTCQLQEAEYCGIGVTKETIPDTTIHTKNNISFKVTVEKEEPVAETTPEPKPVLIQPPSLGLNKLEQYADDTFENILLVTSHHEALMTFYYLDDSDKMKVAEIFELTDDEANILAEPVEQEQESRLPQHTEEGMENSEFSDTSSCKSAKESAVSSDPESDWNEQTDCFRNTNSSMDESDLRPESDQNSGKNSSNRKSRKSRSSCRSTHTNKPTIVT